MNILIDINHPAHVHYFRNFAKIMISKGHKILFTSRNKEIEQVLLDYYGLKYINRGKGRKGIIGKLFYLLKADYIIFKVSKKFKPDIFLSFGSIYAAKVSKLLRKPHIAFDDTEHSKYQNFLYSMFSDVVLTPECFIGDLNNRQIRFNGFMELCYLHPNYFKPDPSVLSLLGVKEDEKYVILRFVAWNASHDVGQTGLNLDEKRELVKEVKKYARVFISSERELPQDLLKYKIQIPPEKMHDVLNYATMFIGESGTMASECAVLGVPTIYVNSLPLMGYLKEEQKKGMLFHFNNSKGVLEKTSELLERKNLKQEFQKNKISLLKDKIDVTAFMVWFIENYLESVEIMRKNPEYQYRFK